VSTRWRNLSSKVSPLSALSLKRRLFRIRNGAKSPSFPSQTSPITQEMPSLSTNLIERSFVEERRGTKAIPGFWTEMGCLK